MAGVPLEVGYHDTSLGWVSVSAAVGHHGAPAVSLSGTSGRATEALETMLPSLRGYLHEQQIAVHSVSLAAHTGAAGSSTPSSYGASERSQQFASTAGDGSETGSSHTAREGSQRRGGDPEVVDRFAANVERPLTSASMILPATATPSQARISYRI